MSFNSSILDSQTHFKPTETFQYTHFSSCHPLKTKKVFTKGEAQSLLRTNSVKENFDKHKRDLQPRLCNRSCPKTFVHKILTEVQFSNRTKILHDKTKKAKDILPFVTTYNPVTPNLKKTLMKHWHIIQQQRRLAHISNQPPIVSYRKEKITQGHFSPCKTSSHHAAIIKTCKQRSTFKRFFSTRKEMYI